jgi:hypothetical protein
VRRTGFRSLSSVNFVFPRRISFFSTNSHIRLGCASDWFSFPFIGEFRFSSSNFLFLDEFPYSFRLCVGLVFVPFHRWISFFLVEFPFSGRIPIYLHLPPNETGRMAHIGLGVAVRRLEVAVRRLRAQCSPFFQKTCRWPFFSRGEKIFTLEDRWEWESHRSSGVKIDGLSRGLSGEQIFTLEG